MPKQTNDFLKKLLSTFKVEAGEHIQAMTTGLLELEKRPAPQRLAQLVEMLFREAHSLKGAARAVNMNDVEAICQSLENVFAAAKRNEIQFSPSVLDTLHESADLLNRIVTAAGTRESPAEHPRISGHLELLDKIPAKGKPARQTTPAERPVVGEPVPTGFRALEKEKPPELETLRIAAAKLDALLLQAEELLAVKLTTAQRAGELRELFAAIAQRKREWGKLRTELGTLRRTLKKNDGQPITSFERGPVGKDGQILKLFELIDHNGVFLQTVEEKVAALQRRANEDLHTVSTAVDALLKDVKQVVVLPFSTILEVFPKFVRDIARDQKKTVELHVQGAEIAVDKRILEEMKNPLTHLIRNCIDHGIEKPDVRERTKKPRQGTIRIGLSQKEGNRVEIVISDDGAGINKEEVLSRAVRLGFITEQEAQELSPQEACGFIFRSGISTSPMITDISGRGLGLAIVQEKVLKLGGTVTVETEANVGTTFRIFLPLSLASFRGILLRTGESFFVLPVRDVERVVRVAKSSITTVENKETMNLNGEAVAVARLSHTLGLPLLSNIQKRKAADDKAVEYVQTVIVTHSERRIAFVVDEVVGEQEVLVKSLGRQLAGVPNISGATVLGSGSVVPILNADDILTSAVRTGVPRGKPGRPEIEAKETRKKSILVVEDSITARTLLKNILATAGYDVSTAVDGVDAFTQLRTGTFELVVSDVDMPRMNGFDLTAKIRGDKKLADLPVVLVTALESREDRERGVDVGASAYIVKSSFDQSNLLDVMKRLI